MFRRLDVDEVLDEAKMESTPATRTLMLVLLYTTAVIIYPFMVAKHIFKKK